MEQRCSISGFAVLTATALALIGCEGEGGQPDWVVVTDSAGVPFHTSPGTVLDHLLPAGLPSEPHLRIGSMQAGEETDFSSILDAIRLSDGRIVVAESGARRIRLFAGDGTFERWIGEVGDGPGGYALVGSIGVLPGDTIWVHDSRHRRFALFTTDGTFLRGFLPQRPAGVTTLRRSRILRTGEVVDEGTTFDLSGVAAATESYMEDVVLSVMDRDGQSASIVGQEPGLLYRVGTVMTQRREVRTFTTGLDDRFAATPFFALGVEHVYRADPGAFEVRELNPAGELVRVLRVEADPIPLTSSLIETYEERLLATVPDRVGMTERLRITTYAESLPHFGAVLEDDAGGVWVGEFVEHRPGDSDTGRVFPGRWWRFGPEGALEGVLELPEAFQLLRIQDGEFFGVTRDAFDVPYLVAYRP